MTETNSTYQERRESRPPFEIRISSYQSGDRYYCKVDNVSPGACVARGEGATREEAETAAIAEADKALKATRVFS